MQTSLSRPRFRLPAAAGALGALLASLAAGTAGAAPHAAVAGVPRASTVVMGQKGKLPSPYQATVAYPVLTGGSAAGTAKINLAMKADARALLAGFLRTVPAGPLPKGAAGMSTLTVRATTNILTNRLVGFDSLVYSYSAGAAHGISGVTTATFNAATGARYSLASLFKPAAEYLAFLTRQSRALLPKVLGSMAVPQMLDPGTTPKAVNFQGWSLTPFGLQITFGDYQVAAYAAGTPTILIPFSALAPLARPNGPIAMAQPTGPVQMALLPATIPPVVAECFIPFNLSQSNPPAICANGRLNVVAWNQLANYDAHVLKLGPDATAHQALLAVCADGNLFQLPPSQARYFLQVVATYYGWRFSPAAALATYPRACPPYKAPAAG